MIIKPEELSSEEFNNLTQKISKKYEQDAYVIRIYNKLTLNGKDVIELTDLGSTNKNMFVEFPTDYLKNQEFYFKQKRKEMTKTEIKKYKISLSLKELYRLGWDGDRLNLRSIFHNEIVDLMFIQNYKINKIKLNSDRCVILYQEEISCDNCTLDTIKYQIPDKVVCLECQGSGCIENITIARTFTNMCTNCQGEGFVPYEK